MTIRDIRPSRLANAYRERATGRVATVLAHSRRRGLVRLLTAPRPLTMTVERFWVEWIHADLYDPNRK